jgi:hypothetical protein
VYGKEETDRRTEVDRIRQSGEIHAISKVANGTMTAVSDSRLSMPVGMLLSAR